MKIALICDSLLLDRSLEMHLKEYLTSYKLCDFVVATQPTQSQKPVFLIGDFEGAQLKIPFTRELLLDKLESFYQQLQDRNTNISSTQESAEQDEILADYEKFIQSHSEDSKGLDEKIEEILRRYAREIQEVVMEHLKNKNV